ncbi:hypothetical protein SS50377_20968 [Spironucleus salmonicida]|uniref:Uncharacterized protein n=1 Tax=Spironucleus salmonicida TaxID=348837 RepID=V6LH55_9EUKA|nr:hypothetical protein SS50377_20968 [Spironucleus salmonicida]|eukprot:EST43638.1 Hypothetical protein SS50377_16681 [Spironucleus salmonicida]
MLEHIITEKYPYEHQITYFSRNHNFNNADNVLLDKLPLSTSESKTLNLIQAETQVRTSETLNLLNSQIRNSFILNYISSLLPFANHHFTVQLPAFMLINIQIKECVDFIQYLLKSELFNTINIKNYVINAQKQYLNNNFDLSLPVPVYELMKIAPIFQELKKGLMSAVLPDSSRQKVLLEIYKQASLVELGNPQFDSKQEFSIIRYFTFGLHKELSKIIYQALHISDSERVRLVFLKDLFCVLQGIKQKLNGFICLSKRIFSVIFNMKQTILAISLQSEFAIQKIEINDVFNFLFPTIFCQKHVVKICDLCMKIEENYTEKALITIKNELEQTIDDFRKGLLESNLRSYI